MVMLKFMQRLWGRWTNKVGSAAEVGGRGSSPGGGKGSIFERMQVSVQQGKSKIERGWKRVMFVVSGESRRQAEQEREQRKRRAEEERRREARYKRQELREHAEIYQRLHKEAEEKRKAEEEQKKEESGFWREVKEIRQHLSEMDKKLEENGRKLEENGRKLEEMGKKLEQLGQEILEVRQDVRELYRADAVLHEQHVSLLRQLIAVEQVKKQALVVEFTAPSPPDNRFPAARGA